ncbi:hypothetical protein ACTL32_01105 [Planococcus sp. FY231025]|uniref:hypothetical protein n=1 Tax=Planococcus sp. FY231025 TaxID=3455699 RepID=UPI003F8E1695
MENLFIDQDYSYIDETRIDGNVKAFEFNHSKGRIKHQFFKKEIPVKIDGKTYYDLTTPFHYGGPKISDCNEEDKWELVDEFQRAFQVYCEENNIISELVYFNSVFSNMVDFVCCYEVECIEETTDSTNICTGKKIWNSQLYENACIAMKVGLDGDFFPAYRRKKFF